MTGYVPTQRVRGYVLTEPWALLGGGQHRQPFTANDGEDLLEVRGPQGAYLVVPARARVRFGPRREPLPSQGAPFSWPEHEGPLVLRALPAPAIYGDCETVSEESLAAIDLDGRQLRLRVRRSNYIGRPHVARVSDGDADDTPSWRLMNLVDWQVGCFQELADLEQGRSALDADTRVGLIRRDWSVARATWLSVDGVRDDPARMALIVRLSRDNRLRTVLDELCRRPRRILQRYRDAERLNRISEVDAACLRWLARQPGRTAAEKAGPRQRLLAVKRREHYDTLENRVLSWALARCRRLSTRYLRHNRVHRDGSARCRDVSHFEASLDWLAKNTPIGTVPPQLPSPVQPNYQLQQHAKYRRIWHLYRRLIEDARVEDDAWRWHSTMWKETCGQILGAYLTAAGRIVQEAHGQTPLYVRTECQSGRWTESPSTPGPFQQDGNLLYLVDPRDGAPPEEWAQWLGGLGTDLGLVSEATTGARRVCAVWFLQTWDVPRDFSAARARCRAALKARMAYLATYRSIRITIDGLILATQTAEQSVTNPVAVFDERVAGTEAQLFALRLPPDIHEHSEGVLAGLDLVIEALVTE